VSSTKIKVVPQVGRAAPHPARNLRKIARHASPKYQDFIRRAIASVKVDDEVETELSKLSKSYSEASDDKNLYLMEDLSVAERALLLQNIKLRLSMYLDVLSPRRLSHGETITHTNSAYAYPVSTMPVPIKCVTERKVINACLLINRHEPGQEGDTAAKLIEDLEIDNDGADDYIQKVLNRSGGDILKKLYNNAGDMESTQMQEAIEHFKETGKIVSVLKETEEAYVDIIKLADKYSIRIGDGTRFVASDGVKVTFRDPSENPAWAMWFLDAVPLAKVPDRAAMFFLPKEEWAQHYPEPLESHPIICHASLWRLDTNCTGVLLHTAWNNLAVAYRWKIDKPLDVARIMFKAVSHPAHIARNFGKAPQLVQPGEGWF